MPRIMSLREKTYAVKGTVSFNAPGNWPVPFGKGYVTISGKAQDGAAGYSYTTVDQPGYSATVVDQPGYTATVVDQPGYTATVVDQPGNTDTVVDQPAYSTTNYVCLEIDTTTNYNTGDPTSYAVNYSYNNQVCPTPHNAPIGYLSYSCSPVYSTTNYPANYKTVTNNPNYKTVTYNPNYKTVTYNPNYKTVYYNPNYTTAYYNPTTGASTTVGNVYFPGGYGGPAPVVNATLAVTYGSAPLSVSVPSGGYINITVS